MQENRKEGEKIALTELLSLEDLVEKKTKIYSRLLTDAALAKDMERLSLRHKKRKETLCALITGKLPKNKNGQGRCETSKEGAEE